MCQPGFHEKMSSRGFHGYFYRPRHLSHPETLTRYLDPCKEYLPTFPLECGHVSPNVIRYLEPLTFKSPSAQEMRVWGFKLTNTDPHVKGIRLDGPGVVYVIPFQDEIRMMCVF